jgi:hypothetical protein
MTLETAVGPVTVFHRLALGVECVDALLDRLVLTPVRAGREVVERSRPRPLDPSWPCLDLQRSGPARFKLGHHPPLPGTFVVRIDDASRRFVPRRLEVHPWPLADVEDGPGRPFVPVRSRLLRSWLWPGSAYPFPRGTTVIRGRVVRQAVPVRWARLTAIGPTGSVAGRAHADERGEFVLVVTDPAQQPLQRSVDVDLAVVAPSKAPTAEELDPFDRCADLVVEPVPRSSLPPADHDLDSPLLRGAAVPPGYVANSHPPRRLTVPVGAELTLTEDVVFGPQP